MSRFIDRLSQASRAVPQSIGFRAGRTTSPKSRMLLVASVAEADVGSLAGYVAGADAGLLHISESSSGPEYLQRMIRAVPDIPWGGWLEGIGSEGIKGVEEAGLDFVVFPAANTPLAVPRSDKVGRILQVEASLTEGLLRAVNELPVDAVFIAGEQKEGTILTWHHLMIFQHFADLLTKPLLASVPSNIAGNEILDLWVAGMDGVVVEAGQVAGGVKQLRQMIDQLNFPKRKRGRAEALLPYVGGETGIMDEEE